MCSASIHLCSTTRVSELELRLPGRCVRKRGPHDFLWPSYQRPSRLVAGSIGVLRRAGLTAVVSRGVPPCIAGVWLIFAVLLRSGHPLALDAAERRSTDSLQAMMQRGDRARAAPLSDRWELPSLPGSPPAAQCTNRCSRARLPRAHGANSFWSVGPGLTSSTSVFRGERHPVPGPIGIIAHGGESTLHRQALPPLRLRIEI